MKSGEGGVLLFCVLYGIGVLEQDYGGHDLQSIYGNIRIPVAGYCKIWDGLGIHTHMNQRTRRKIMA